MTPTIDLWTVFLVLVGVPVETALVVLGVAALPAGWRPVVASTLAVLAVCFLPLALSAGV